MVGLVIDVPVKGRVVLKGVADLQPLRIEQPEDPLNGASDLAGGKQRAKFRPDLVRKGGKIRRSE